MIKLFILFGILLIIPQILICENDSLVNEQAIEVSRIKKEIKTSYEVSLPKIHSIKGDF
jgi:hypothetical protein